MEAELSQHGLSNPSITETDVKIEEASTTIPFSIAPEQDDQDIELPALKTHHTAESDEKDLRVEIPDSEGFSDAPIPIEIARDDVSQHEHQDFSVTVLVEGISVEANVDMDKIEVVGETNRDWQIGAGEADPKSPVEGVEVASTSAKLRDCNKDKSEILTTKIGYCAIIGGKESVLSTAPQLPATNLLRAVDSLNDSNALSNQDSDIELAGASSLKEPDLPVHLNDGPAFGVGGPIIHFKTSANESSKDSPMVDIHDGPAELSESSNSDETLISERKEENQPLERSIALEARMIPDSDDDEELSNNRTALQSTSLTTAEAFTISQIPSTARATAFGTGGNETAITPSSPQKQDPASSLPVTAAAVSSSQVKEQVPLNRGEPQPTELTSSPPQPIDRRPSSRARLPNAPYPTPEGSQNKGAWMAELKAMKIASIQARNAALEAEIASKRAKLADVTKVLIRPAAETVKRHIKLLHDYNDIRDVGQGLIGMIADNRGVRIGELYGEFGVGLKD